MNTKGLSEVIGTVVLILLSVASVALLVPAVINLVEQPGEQLAPAAECINIQGNPPELQSAQYNAEGILEVTIRRTPTDDYTTTLGFLVADPQESSRFECGLQCGGGCHLQQPGQTKTFFFNTQQAQEVTLYVNENCIIDTIPVS